VRRSRGYTPEPVLLEEDGPDVLGAGGEIKNTFALLKGSRRSLGEARAEGARVEVVYSPMDAFKIAKMEKALKVVFFATGFETTSPLFVLRCTPQTPVGPCMVSDEGSYAAYYKYGGAYG